MKKTQKTKSYSTAAHSPYPKPVHKRKTTFSKTNEEVGGGFRPRSPQDYIDNSVMMKFLSKQKVGVAAGHGMENTPTPQTSRSVSQIVEQVKVELLHHSLPPEKSISPPSSPPLPTQPMEQSSRKKTTKKNENPWKMIPLSEIESCTGMINDNDDDRESPHSFPPQKKQSSRRLLSNDTPREDFPSMNTTQTFPSIPSSSVSSFHPPQQHFRFEKRQDFFGNQLAFQQLWQWVEHKSSQQHQQQHQQQHSKLPKSTSKSTSKQHNQHRVHNQVPTMVLLCGPCGVGKTEAARCALTQFGYHIFAIDASSKKKSPDELISSISRATQTCSMTEQLSLFKRRKPFHSFGSGSGLTTTTTTTTFSSFTNQQKTTDHKDQQLDLNNESLESILEKRLEYIRNHPEEKPPDPIPYQKYGAIIIDEIDAFWIDSCYDQQPRFHEGMLNLIHFLNQLNSADCGPIIFICNDMYHRSLQMLRYQVFGRKPSSSCQIVRFQSVCESDMMSAAKSRLFFNHLPSKDPSISSHDHDSSRLQPTDAQLRSIIWEAQGDLRKLTIYMHLWFSFVYVSDPTHSTASTSVPEGGENNNTSVKRLPPTTAFWTGSRNDVFLCNPFHRVRFFCLQFPNSIQKAHEKNRVLSSSSASFATNHTPLAESRMKLTFEDRLVLYSMESTTNRLLLFENYPRLITATTTTVEPPFGMNKRIPDQKVFRCIRGETFLQRISGYAQCHSDLDVWHKECWNLAENDSPLMAHFFIQSSAFYLNYLQLPEENKIVPANSFLFRGQHSKSARQKTTTKSPNHQIPQAEQNALVTAPAPCSSSSISLMDENEMKDFVSESLSSTESGDLSLHFHRNRMNMPVQDLQFYVHLLRQKQKQDPGSFHDPTTTTCDAKKRAKKRDLSLNLPVRDPQTIPLQMRMLLSSGSGSDAGKKNPLINPHPPYPVTQTQTINSE